MTWVKLSDTFAEDPRLVKAGESAFVLHVAALCFCNRNLTDGHVSREMVGRLWAVKRPKAVAARLVEVGLWEETEDGYLLVEFLKEQPSRAQVEEDRRKAAGRQARYVSRRRDDGVSDTVSNGVSDGVTDGAPPRPDPSRSRRGENRSLASLTHGGGAPGPQSRDECERFDEELAWIEHLLEGWTFEEQVRASNMLDKGSDKHAVVNTIRAVRRDALAEQFG